MRKIYLFLILVFITPFVSFSQYKDALKEAFFDAEYYMLYEDYNEALTIYLNVLNNGLDNAYINHRIGECYLQIPGLKQNSIPYLEKACKNTSNVIKEGSFKETKAPIRALFYLASAYQINNEFDKAIQTYKKFEDLLADQKIYNIDYVERQIESCKTAIDLINKPLNVKETNLGKLINDNFSNICPVISGNEKSMVYISKLKFYDAIFYSQKSGDQWTAPINITPDLNSDGNFYPCFLSNNGNILVLYKDDKFNRDIYLSHLANGKWSRPEKLNKNINTKFNESFASITSDGKTIYFVSDRKGGYGGTDIYKSKYNEVTKEWGEAINLGNKINTSFNEETPVICENDQVLYFSSEGHYNMGGFDIFYSELKTNQWTEPKNVGYPINTTDDNVYFYPLGNGNHAYISKFDKNGYGQEDIVMLDIYQ